ncbi:carboxypeptidase-like regulatory domain-containing protein [Erythrobacter sp. F6033]|uniref:TonB-dependent receptor n=1 Tax=Erythrobacter sp. F6033 TaxID=2926401 RepID=UPI001FF36066|nr:carboxypeptidase-like regulatory domain-containing protein [Erythrobacter sp. F6033]MCK0129357.1 carboxypeptidase regulatory-like domain-containing protein [Erythrobacter sp. F6033]
MKLKYLLAASVVSLSAAATIATPAAAQSITSGIEGQVVDASGTALAGATITIVDERTGATRDATASANGDFRVGSLQPGGPYTVTVTAPGYEGQTVENVFTSISGNTGFNFTLNATAAGGTDNVIVVTGARAQVTQLAVGPGTAFDTQTLEAFPSITRDVRDIIRIDPRVSLEASNDVDRISCLGGNDRTNTFTVDGIVQSDTFGLNGTPFASRNSLPLPFDVVEQVSVEFAPFDVEYSEFTGCLVNVVTKSGSNKFSGSAFITYFDGGLFADQIDGRPLNANEEKRWGATLSGPIIPDRLFFSAGYEEVDLGQGNNFGPAGGGFTNEADFVSQAQFDTFAEIANRVYGQDVGGYPTTLSEGNVRYFGRLDAIINDDHRLEATYQRLEETNIESDFGGQNITGFNSFEDEGTISDYYSVRLYSDWSDTISTELRVSRSEVGDVQGPVGFGEAQSANPTPRLVVGVTPDGTAVSGGGVTDQNGILSTGPGIFRSANQLDTKIDQARFQMNVDAGSGHFIKLGAEINDLQVFNLFAINATGSLYFENFADFEQGLLSGGTELFPNADEIATGQALGGDINAAIDGDINNAAALFSRRIYSVYAQDEWQATDQLTVNAGIRVQLYDGDAPRANPNFLERYGFTNANSFGRIDTVLLPRLSATYEFDNDGFISDSRITGGVGIFSGGDPVVYYSNAFSNNGFSSALGTTRFDCSATDIAVDPVTGQFDVVTNGTFTGFPQCAIDGGAADAAAGLADVQSTAPDFDVPTVTRASLAFQTTIGAETGFFSNWNLQLDYIYSKFNDALNFVDLSQTPDIRTGINGFTVDGRPIYQAIDSTNAGCNAVLQGTGGTPPVYTGVTADCFNTRRDDNIQLTNAGSSEAHSASIVLSKQFESGLFTQGGSTRVTLGYAYTDSNNARNNQSSTATSSFDVTAAFDRQNPAVSTATTETRHNFTAAVNFREQFLDGYDTSFGFFFRAREGRPYSLTFDGGGVFADSSSGTDNALLYVPTGVNDVNVSPMSDPAAVAAVVDYVAASGCDFTPGATILRNTCRNDWHIDMDLRFSQEIPFLGSLTGIADDRIELFADFSNFLNLINDEWNILRSRGGFNGLVDVADGGVDDDGRYIISGFNPDDQNNIAINPSAWRIQIGARYEF